MAETKTAVGSCKSVEIKSGWHIFHVTVPGSQYPLKLATKLKGNIDAGIAMGATVAAWTYSESPGPENPNRPGTNYINRRLEKVEAASAAQVAAAESKPASSGGGERDEDRGPSIERQVVVKAAFEAGLYPGGLIETDEQFFELLEKVAEFIARRPDAPKPSEEEDQPPTTETAEIEVDDDDIPF